MSEKRIGQWSRRWAVWVFLWLWFAMTLPVVSVLAVNEYSRFILMQTCAHWRGKVLGSDSVFIGDSIMSGGRNWGWRLGFGPFNSRNLAASGSTVRQVKAQALEALKYRPAHVFIMAGTNDILEERDVEASMCDYDALLKTFPATPGAAVVVVTLVPQTAVENFAAAINDFNRQLRALCQRHGVKVVDLNPRIAPRGLLLPQFSLDDVHLTQAAYEIWTEELKAMMAVPPG
jgi:lysophospholipase L1-like esterase